MCSDSKQTLIVTRRGMPVTAVADGLRARGRDVVILETDDLGDGTTASLLPGGVLRLRQRIGDAEQIHTLDRLESVWYRRMFVQPHLPAATSSDVTQGVTKETRAFLLGLLAQFEARGVRVMQPKAHITHADRKPRQLALASAAGLDVPRTITTTSPAEVRAFLSACPGRLITKVYTGFALGNGPTPEVVMTSEVDREDLLAPGGLDGIELCPTTFQELLPKERELRVTLVGTEVLAASIDTRGVSAAEVDWRRAQHAVLDRWRPDSVPESVRSALLRLTKRLGLTYAAVDLIKTTDDRWVFLEANPGGEYLWIDEVLGGAINRAIVDWLALGRNGVPHT